MKLWIRILLGIIPPVAIVGVYVAQTSSGSSAYFPPATDIAHRFQELWLFGNLMSDVIPSLRNLTFGYFIGISIGLAIGMLLGRIEWAHDAFVGLLHLGRSVPPIMLIPPLVLVLGVGDTSKISIIAFGAIPPICLATIDGIRQVQPVQIDMARTISLGRVATLREVYLPSASPSIFGGAQISLQVAFVLMVASEMLAAFRGLGHITMQAQLSFDSRTMWAGIILLALLGFLTNALFTLVRNRMLAWHIEMNNTQAKG